MRLLLIPILLAAAGCASVAAPSAQTSRPAPEPATSLAAAEDEGVGHTLLLYLPNRLFDLLDIVRLRVRVGPGAALSLRATEFLDLNLGGYASVFVGIPGPRGEPDINWPAGLEALAGAEASVLDATTGGGAAPYYGAFEFGAGVHLLLLGIDLGVDPWEAVDFLAGILTIDPVSDDF